MVVRFPFLRPIPFDCWPDCSACWTIHGPKLPKPGSGRPPRPLFPGTGRGFQSGIDGIGLSALCGRIALLFGLPCPGLVCGQPLRSSGDNTQHSPKAAATSVSESSVGIVDEQGRWLVVRRPSKGRWGLMWEFPRVEINPGEEIIGAVKRAAFDLAGLRLVDPQKATKIHHAVTRFKVTLELWTAGMADPASKVLLSFHLESAWVYPKDFALLAAATPQRKLMAWIKQKHSPDGPSGAS